MNGIGITLPDELLDDLADRIAARLGSDASEPATAWLDVEGAAAHLATSRKRIYDLVEQHRIPVHREGRRLLFDRHELDAWIRDGRSADFGGGG